MKGLLISALAGVAVARPHLQTRQFTPLPLNQLANGKCLYTISNTNESNAIITLPLNSDGTIASQGPSYPTGGKGARSDVTTAFPGLAFGDSLNSQYALRMAGDKLITVNAGSNTVSMFQIDYNDPTKLTQVGENVDSLGDWPSTVDVSVELKTACVANTGTRSGVACYKITNKGLVPLDTAQRPVALSPPQSNPTPVGPFNTLSQLLFTKNNAELLIINKGNLPNGVAPSITSFAVQNGLVGTVGTTSKPNGTDVLFGAAFLDDDKSLIITDAGYGSAVLSLQSNNTYQTSYQYTISDQSANCWATRTPYNNVVYETDIGINHIVAFDGHTGHFLSKTNFTNGNPNLMEMTTANDKLWSISFGNDTYPQHVLTMGLTQGNNGIVTELQNFQLTGTDANLEGLQVLQENFGYAVNETNFDWDCYWGKYFA